MSNKVRGARRTAVRVAAVQPPSFAGAEEHRNAAQAGQSQVEQAGIKRSERRGRMRERPEHEPGEEILDDCYSIHSPPSTRSPS